MNSEMEGSRLIAVGKIVKAHGVKGEVKVFPYGESMAFQSPGGKLFLGGLSEVMNEALTLMSARSQGKTWIVRFQELTSMDEAQRIIGCEVLLPEDDLPPTQEGEYYHYQLIGLEVVTKAGVVVGILRGVMETGSHDVYSVESCGREMLIPAVEEIICEIDLKQNRMVIDPPEGLLDDL